MSKSFFFPALLLFLIACSPAVETDVPQPQEEAATIQAELLEIINAIDYAPGKAFRAVNKAVLASGQAVEVSSIQLTDAHWAQLETGDWVISPEYVEEDLAFEYLDTYEGEVVVEQSILISEVSDEAGKTSVLPSCTDFQLYGCSYLWNVLPGVYFTSSPTCPCLAICHDPFFGTTLILIPCRDI